jgi:aminoglycoside 6'-N-acetyltransferase I
MQVRLIEPETDREEWLRMRLALWPEYSAEELQIEMDEILRERQRTPVFVAARSEGGLGGFLEAGVRAYVDGCDTSPVGFIEGWYVDPDLRRQGMGRELVAAAEAWAAGRGYKEMASNALVENELSHQAHQALGYEPVEQVTYFRKRLKAAANRQVFQKFVVLIRPTRPGFLVEATAEENEAMRAHFGYLQEGVAEGTVLLAGPCLDRTFGLILLQAESEAAVQQFMQADPSVRAGVMRPEIHALRISLVANELCGGLP